jgi:hypothetical protein
MMSAIMRIHCSAVWEPLVPVQTQAPLCRPQEPTARYMGLAHHSKRSITAISIDMFADALLRALHHP